MTTLVIADAPPEQPGEDLADLRLLKVPEICRITTLSRSHVYSLMDAGKLAYIKAGRARRVPLSALREFLQRNRVGT